MEPWEARVYLISILRSIQMASLLVVFPIMAARDHISPFMIGLLVAGSVLLSVVYTFYLSRYAALAGFRVVSILIGFLWVIMGLFGYFTHGFLGFYGAALLGFLPPSGGGFLHALEEGMLGHSQPSRRNKVYAQYGLFSSVAFSLAVLVSGPLFSSATGLHILWGIITILGVLVILLSVGLQNIHAEVEQQEKQGLHESKALVYRLAGLFVADSLGSGLVTAPLIIYWLHVNDHMTPTELSVLFFAMGLLEAISFPVAEWISRKVGLVNTAVFTHIPSSVFLLFLPWAHAAWLASLLLLARAFLVEMDVPTRQAYIAAVVKPEERAQAAGVTTMGKLLGRAIGPVLGGYALSVSAIFPFVGAAVVKISYDLALWTSFRHVPTRQED